MYINVHFKFLFLTLIFLVNLKSSWQITYCNGRINDPEFLLYANEMNALCSKILSDDRFLFNIQKKIVIPNTYEEELFYTSAVNNMFLDRCQKFNVCKTGFLICVFSGAKKVRIMSGSGISVINSNLDSVVNLMKPYLVNNDFYNAFNVAFQSLKINHPTIVESKITTVTTKTTTHTHKSGYSFWWVFFLIIVPVCICCCFCYYMYIKQQEEHKIEQTLKMGATPEEIYNHISKLENLLSQTRTSPIIRVDYCLICFKSIFFSHCPASVKQYELHEINQNNMNVGLIQNPQGSLLNKDVYDNLNTRFECDHIFHTSCLCTKNVNFCLLCKSTDYSTPSMKVPNNSDYQLLNEYQINTMIKNLKFLYSKEQIVSYSTAYPEHYRSHNTIIILDDYHYYHPDYHYGGYNHGYYDAGYNNTTTTTTYVETNVVDSGVIHSGGGNYGNYGGEGGDYGNYGSGGGDYGSGGGDYGSGNGEN